MRDYILLFGLALYFFTWINFRAMLAKEQKITQKETKEILNKRLKEKTESIKKHQRKTTDPKKIVGFPQENLSVNIEEFMSADSFIYSHMNKRRLLISIKRAEFKREVKKFSKVLLCVIVVLWSSLTFYDLYKDISWKQHIDQFRWLMFYIDFNLGGSIQFG